ncbi:hypothetical protein [Brasilonema bromeliae]|uniref:Uncharacterized protein n=1 Tax=Brasilonema bromeliae SPC951 TaxID=385972 RepID=A0ABX1P163_9CYAN|nr:hypothetical protein [Brasilonema bromeliae SPC951]
MQIEFYSSVSYLPGYTKLQLTTVNRSVLRAPGAQEQRQNCFSHYRNIGNALSSKSMIANKVDCPTA